MNNSEITREHDVILARKFGWSAIGHHEGWGDHPIEGYSRIPTYLTAPTFESDGIVLEWVQGRAEMIFEMQFCNSVREIVSGREEDEPVKERYYLNFFLRHYKPGDYASALLEVISK